MEEKYKLKSEELQNFYDQSIKKRKLERDREEEEYNYKIKREREISNNEWEDLKQKREKELKAKEDEAAKLLDEATIKSKNIADLEEKVASIPVILEKEYERGKKDTTLELEKEYKYKNDLLCKDYQNTIDRQNDKIESLQEELSKVRELNKLLQEKNDKAYLQIKEMATKTVEATGGVKIIANKQSEN